SYNQYNTPPGIIYLFRNGIVKVLLHNVDSIHTDNDQVNLLLELPFVPGNPFSNTLLSNSLVSIAQLDSLAVYLQVVAGVDNRLKMQLYEYTNQPYTYN